MGLILSFILKGFFLRKKKSKFQIAIDFKLLAFFIILRSTTWKNVSYISKLSQIQGRLHSSSSPSSPAEISATDHRRRVFALPFVSLTLLEAHRHHRSPCLASLQNWSKCFRSKLFLFERSGSVRKWISFEWKLLIVCFCFKI